MSNLKLMCSCRILSAIMRSRSFGKLSVAANQKWNALFRQCYQSMGVSEAILTPSGNHLSNGSSNVPDNVKIWQNVAVAISSSHKHSKPGKKTSGSDVEKSVDCLEVIPVFGQKTLTLTDFTELKQYLYNVSIFIKK